MAAIDPLNGSERARGDVAPTHVLAPVVRAEPPRLAARYLRQAAAAAPIDSHERPEN